MWVVDRAGAAWAGEVSCAVVEEPQSLSVLSGTVWLLFPSWWLVLSEAPAPGPAFSSLQ